MSFVTAQLSQFKVDKGRFTRALRDEIAVQVKIAAREFLRAAFLRVPYRTGFARGGFLNLVDAIGEGNVSGGIRRTTRQKIRRGRKRPSRLTSPTVFAGGRGISIALDRGFGQVRASTKQEWYYHSKGMRIRKTLENARQFSTPIAKIFQRESDLRFTFNYAVSISYFRINDATSNPRTPSSPWVSFLAGMRAFNVYISREAIKHLPQLGGFMSSTELRVSGSQYTKRTAASSLLVRSR